MKKDPRNIDREDVSDLQQAFRELAADEPPTDFLARVMERAAQEPLFTDIPKTGLDTGDQPSLPEAFETESAISTVLTLDLCRRRRWLRPLMTVPGVAALAACLLLSLTANAWFGTRTWFRHGPWSALDGSQGLQHTAQQRQAFRALLADLNPPGMTIGFNAHLFQLGIHTTKNLGTLVASHPAFETKTNALGFTGTSGFYVVGALYAESLAYLYGGQLEAAAQRLSSIERELRRTPVTDDLATYLGTLRQALEQRQYPVDALGNGLAMFQSLGEKTAAQQGTEPLILFRVGVWLVNMKLAALSEDIQLLPQGNIAPYFIRALSALNAPDDLLTAFVELDRIVQPAMTIADSREVVVLINQLQRLLE